MWRPLRNTFPSVLIGVAACVFLAGMALAYLIALPLPEWASDRIEAAISDHLPVDVMASEGFSLTLGQSPDTLAVGVDRVIIREQKTAMDVTLEETVLAIRILDLLRGTFAIESIAIGHLDWQQTTTDQSGNGAGQVSNGRWNPGEAVLDVRPAVRWLDQIKGRLDRLTIERFSSEFYLPHAAKALVLDGSFTVSGSSAGWQGVLRGEVKHDASRIGDIEGTFTIDGTDRHPEIVVMMMSDTAALAPFLNRPAVIPDVQFSTRLSPVWDHNSRLTGIAFVFEGAGDSWAPAGSSGNGLSRSGSVNSGSSADASLVLEGVYQWQSGVIELENLSLVVPEAELAGSGTMLIDFSDSGVLQGLSGSAHIETVQLRTDRFHHELLQPVEGSLTFALDAGAKRNHFMEFEFASAATGGRVTYEANGDQADEVSVHVDALMVEKMIALWPEGVFDNTRRWLATAIIGGRVSDFNGLFKIPQAGPMASQMSFQFRDLDFTPIRGHLPVMASSGHIEMTEEEMQIVFVEGSVDVPDKGLIDLGGSSMHIPKIQDASHPSSIQLNFSGDLGAVLEVINREPLAFMAKVNLSPDIATGQTEGVIVIEMPLLAQVEADEIKIKLNAIIKDLVAYGLWPGQAIRANVASVTADEQQIEVLGEAFVGELLVNAGWDLVYDGSRQSVSGTVRLDEKLFDQVNAAGIGSYVSGHEEATFRIDLNAPGGIPYQLTSPLTAMNIAIPEIGWRKPAGLPVDFLVQGRIGSPVTVDQIRLVSPDFEFDGAMRMGSESGRVEEINLRRVRLGDAYEGPADLTLGADGSLSQISMPGTLTIADLDMDFSRPDSGPGHPLDVSIGAIAMADTVSITGVNGRFGGHETYDARLVASLNGTVPIQIGITQQDNRSRLVINANDAGGVARELGLTGNLAGGRLKMDVVYQAGQDAYTGNIQINDMTARKMPLILELLSVIAVTGLVDQLSSGGISFSEVRGQFTLTPELLTIKDGSANSSSIGFTARGTYDLTDRTMDIRGSMTPNVYVDFVLNTIIPIGRLVGQREGEQLGTIRYSISGPAESPTIESNALTILSPIGSGDFDANDNN